MGSFTALYTNSFRSGERKLNLNQEYLTRSRGGPMGPINQCARLSLRFSSDFARVLNLHRDGMMAGMNRREMG